ncbi:hypothetical protein C8J57DRAFT_1543255 [Mycena rebaudengoi]|nr:hypothetical protein C8J57DRAFT_1543255 [Mycena rebaudengoi]
MSSPPDTSYAVYLLMPHPSLWLLWLLLLLLLALCGLVSALCILPHRRAGISLLPTADPAARTSAVPPIPLLRGRGRAKRSAFGLRLLPFARSRRDPVLPRHYRAAFAGRGGARVDAHDDATPLLDVSDATSTWRSISSSSGDIVDLETPHSNPLCPRPPATSNPFSRSLPRPSHTHGPSRFRFLDTPQTIPRL